MRVSSINNSNPNKQNFGQVFIKGKTMIISGAERFIKKDRFMSHGDADFDVPGTIKHVILKEGTEIIGGIHAPFSTVTVKDNVTITSGLIADVIKLGKDFKTNMLRAYTKLTPSLQNTKGLQADSIVTPNFRVIPKIYAGDGMYFSDPSILHWKKPLPGNESFHLPQGKLSDADKNKILHRRVEWEHDPSDAEVKFLSFLDSL